MKKMNKMILLSMPLVIAVIWLIYVIAASKTFTLAGGAQLAPVRDITPLVVGLGVFISGYIIFMFLMFSEDLKEMFSRKQPIKKKKNKKK